MTWREAFRMMATNFRARQQGALASPFGTEKERAEKAHAYGVCAEELEYAAALPSHEGVRYVRDRAGGRDRAGAKQ